MHLPFSVLSSLRTDSASDRQVKGVSTAALALASLLALRSGLVLCVELWSTAEPLGTFLKMAAS